VVLADGSSKPIEKVELGDLVVATESETGKTATTALSLGMLGRRSNEL